MQTLTYSTKHKTQMINITEDIRESIIKSGKSDGLVNIFVPHSTCGIIVSEQVDPNLTRDIMRNLQNTVPSNISYQHTGNNADAHIKSVFLGVSVTLPVENATLILGEWQGIFLCDFDGPRERKVYVKIVG